MFFPAALLPALFIAQAPAPAPASTAASDARCIVVFGFIGSRTPQQADATTRGIMYYLGKMRGRDPGVDAAATIAAAADAAKAAGLEAQGEARRCIGEAEGAGAALRAIRATVPPAP